MPVTKYIWDGENYLQETDEDDVTQVTYTNKPEQYGELISQRRENGTNPATTETYHFDGLGSTTELTDENEEVIETYQYDAFGNRRSANDYTPPFTYVGKLGYYTDEETDDYYVRARHLEFSGRFLTVDPARFDVDPMSEGSLNYYVYAHSRPTVEVDPSGLDCSIWFRKFLVAGLNTTSGFDHFGLIFVDKYENEYGVRVTDTIAIDGKNENGVLVFNTNHVDHSETEYWGVSWSFIGSITDRQCRCLKANWKRWNATTRLAYSNIRHNSNYALKCLLQSCNVKAPGWKPVGWHSLSDDKYLSGIGTEDIGRFACRTKRFYRKYRCPASFHTGADEVFHGSIWVPGTRNN